MKKLKTHSKNSLFLAELILSLLFLELACSACVQVFASAYTNRVQARLLNHMQELTTTICEVLEGWDGNPQVLDHFFEEGTAQDSHFTIYYDNDWNACQKDSAAFVMSLDIQITSTQKGGRLTFSRISRESLYQQDIRYPFFGKGEYARE